MLNRNEIISHCLTYKDAYEDYPFGEEMAVIRHSGNKKTFAFIYERGGKLFINLKCEPLRADFLRQVYTAVTPGFHMNKTHWNTVALDGSIPDEELFSMVKHSYELIKPKDKKIK